MLGVCVKNMYSRLVAESSILTNASPAAVWKVWTDVNNWSSWDHDVKSCKFQGEFKKGSKAVLKPASGPSVNIEITEYETLKSFTSTSYLPLCNKLIFKHQMEQVEGGLQITHRVELQGYGSCLFNLLLGHSIKKGLPVALTNLASSLKKTG